MNSFQADELGLVGNPRLISAKRTEEKTTTVVVKRE